MDFRTDSLAGDEIELRGPQPLRRGRLFPRWFETLFTIMVCGAVVSVLLAAWK